MLRLLYVLVLFCLGGCAAKTAEQPAPITSQVEFGGSIWSEPQQSCGVCFQDGGQSFEGPDGWFWLFGDTFLGKPPLGAQPKLADIAGAVSCTMALLPHAETTLPPRLRYETDGHGQAAGPMQTAGQQFGLAKDTRIWPGGGISIGSRQYLYFTVVKVDESKPGPWNFSGIGGGLAVRESPSATFHFVATNDSWHFPVQPIQVLSEKGTLYLLEVRDTEPKGLILARVPAEQIENPSSYEFYTGADWSHDPTAVKPVLREAYGQASVCWCPMSKQYVLATSSDIFHPQEIQLRQASRLEGPWSAPLRIAVPPMPNKTTNLVYGAYIHPELSDLANGRMVLTFCRMLAGEWELSNPEFVTVTLRY